MEFDVFLCHNSQDKPEVTEIALKLEEMGLRPWLDEWELQPGLPWQRELERQIHSIKSAAVFVGESGIGPWQEMEIEAYLRRFVRQRSPVIPVLLPNAPKQPDLPLFLEGMTWVDFRRSRPEPMERLIWGITGVKPKAKVATNKTSDRENKQEQREVQSTSVELGNGITLEMVTIPEGSFLMGTKDEEIERLCKEYNTNWFHREKPQHKVTIQSFSMGKYPVTQEQWRAIANRPDLKINQDLDPNSARFKDRPDSDRRPVEFVSWKDAIEFCGRLSKLTEQDYRLPSEAEWEYACRAGTTTAYSFGDNINKELANYGENIGETTPAGRYPANQFGLYDMHGNAWEWCADYWHDSYENAPTDGRVWLDENDANSMEKVLRSGSWYSNPRNCRSASRYGYDGRDLFYSRVGFRVVCGGFGRT